jgi:hypothetical protein
MSTKYRELSLRYGAVSSVKDTVLTNGITGRHVGAVDAHIAVLHCDDQVVDTECSESPAIAEQRYRGRNANENMAPVCLRCLDVGEEAKIEVAKLTFSRAWKWQAHLLRLCYSWRSSPCRRAWIGGCVKG